MAQTPILSPFPPAGTVPLRQGGSGDARARVSPIEKSEHALAVKPSLHAEKSPHLDLG